ncbi:hypothetical protein ASPTUDRAFT_924927 [Aspergillus tubingensis CBS 134.48]|uniref:Uncharacterized protein n=1 Tax=Aspergillus tubingensis (strain CBS 134.48) TaxID=767770 RepID=A0A1L9NDG2_ASPTC|nr:hypothetical protein ASPTUDRAFT_924927 [Aspergillus tubingensis CBS 134.48]
MGEQPKTWCSHTPIACLIDERPSVLAEVDCRKRCFAELSVPLSPDRLREKALGPECGWSISFSLSRILYIRMYSGDDIPCLTDLRHHYHVPRELSGHHAVQKREKAVSIFRPDRHDKLHSRQMMKNNYDDGCANWDPWGGRTWQAYSPGTERYSRESWDNAMEGDDDDYPRRAVGSIWSLSTCENSLRWFLETALSFKTDLWVVYETKELRRAFCGGRCVVVHQAGLSLGVLHEVNVWCRGMSGQSGVYDLRLSVCARLTNMLDLRTFSDNKPQVIPEYLPIKEEKSPICGLLIVPDVPRRLRYEHDKPRGQNDPDSLCSSYASGMQLTVLPMNSFISTINNRPL